MSRQEIVEKFFKKSYLVSPDFFDDYDNDEEVFVKLNKEHRPLVLNKDLFFVLKKNHKVAEINWLEFEKSRMLLEKKGDGKIYQNFLDILSYEVNVEKKQVMDTIVEDVKQPEPRIIVEREENIPSVVVLESFIGGKVEAKNVDSFVNHFKFRYNALKDMLVHRGELRDVISINRALSRKNKEKVSIIGIVQDKKITRNGHVLLTLEDPTGLIKVLLTKDGSCSDIARDLILDEVIGVVGFGNGEIIFCEIICFPDVPGDKQVKNVADDVCVAFISDIHVGSCNFLEKEFLRFVDWLNLEYGNKKRVETANNIKYLFIVGDLVEGIGVYPDQYNDLTIKDVNKQYDALARYLGRIRKDIKIIICPGDHDALRLAHPQPILDEKIASKIRELRNVTLVSNPSFVNIHSSNNFSGFDVLLYHGHGYHYYIDCVDSLRKKDSCHNPRHIMKFLLQKRHLAPSHTSTIYVPDNKEDFMVIKKVPDIFVSGHLHKSDVSSYNNVITINSSCWQSRTDFQMKVGNFPDPCKVPVLNLRTNEVEVFDFNE